MNESNEPGRSDTDRPLEQIMVERIVADAIENPKVKLLRRLRSPRAREWWLELISTALAGDAGFDEPLTPESLPTPHQLFDLKDASKTRGAAYTETEHAEAAGLYFGAALLFDGHPARPPELCISSLDWRELDEVYVSIGECLGDEWESFVERALQRNEDRD